MMPGGVLPAETAALVIGVEEYGDPDWAVSGPVANAYRFAGWLESRGVPHERITLLVSPFERSQANARQLRAAGLATPDADGPVTRDKVYDVLTRHLVGLGGTGLVVYWCGHGCEDEYGQHLFFEDSLSNGLGLGVNRLLGWLAGERFEAADQLLIVDACRQFADDLGVRISPVAFPPTQRSRNPRQSLLQAVGRGELAPREAAGNITPFTRELLEVLSSPELLDTWLPDVYVLANQIGARLEQSPVTVTYEDPRGNRNTNTLRQNDDRRDGQAIERFPKRQPAATPVLASQPREMVERLLGEVRDFAAGGRGEMVLAEIRMELPNFRLAADMSAKNLAEELNDYPAGWAVLLRVCKDLPEIFDPDKKSVKKLLRYLDEQTGLNYQQKRAIHRIADSMLPWPQAWPALYFHTLDESGVDYPKPVRTVAKAAEVLLSRGGESALCKFLERLARLMDDRAAAELRTLIKAVAVLLDVESDSQAWQDDVADEPLDVRTHVLVRVERQDDGTNLLSGWRFYPSPTAGALPVSLQDSRMIQFDDVPREIEEVPEAVVAALMAPGECLDAALKTAGERDNDRRPVLQLMLPWDELETMVEAWPVKRVDGHSVELGHLLPVVVRPPADITDLGPRHRQYQGWRDIHIDDGHDDRVFRWSGEKPEDFDADHRWLVLAVTQRGPSPRDAARVARGVGISLVIWSPEGADPRDILNGQALRRLPDLAFAERGRGRRVAVIWDDPFWVPEQNELRWRSA
jgi:vWA-MoxR associated protein C-terminal domain